MHLELNPFTTVFSGSEAALSMHNKRCIAALNLVLVSLDKVQANLRRLSRFEQRSSLPVCMLLASKVLRKVLALVLV